MANIIATPAEGKFRKLKKENKLVAQKLLPCRGALAVLVAAGFRSEDVDGVPCLVMPDESVDVARLQSVQSGLEGVVAAFEEHQAAKKAAVLQVRPRIRRTDRVQRHRLRLTRVAMLQERQAQVRAETSKRKATKDALKAAAEGDKLARQDPGWKAKAFSKGGADPARVPGDGRG